MYVSLFYFVTFIFALMTTGVNIFRSKKADTRFLLLGLLVTINSLGRFLLSISYTLELAIWSNKILYIGGCFTAPVMIILVVDLCGFKMSRFTQAFILIYAAITYAFSLTIGHNGVYYKNVNLGHKDGYYYLIKEYGPAHILFPMLTILCLLLLIYYLGVAFKHRKEISFRIVFVVTVLGASVILLYLLERIMHSTIEWTSVSYLIATILMVYLFDHFNMYDMSINISHYVENTKEYGYIVFDKKLRYVNANLLAKALFPEIETWRADASVPEGSSLFYCEIISHLSLWIENPIAKTISIDDKHLELTISDISYGIRGRLVGYIVEITDKTVEHNYIQTMKSYNSDLKREVKEKTTDIMRMQDNLIFSVAVMVESRDNSTGGHIQRTSAVVEVFVNQLRNNAKYSYLTDAFFDNIIKAAPMHDLGKITVDDAILRKQGKFTADEYEQMKKHSEAGASIVERILAGTNDNFFCSIAKNVAHYHHEKWDGTGYPSQLKGADIPIEARIMAFADVYDALVSKRCYKEEYSPEKAMDIISSELGKQFDPNLGELFLECGDELAHLYQSFL